MPLLTINDLNQPLKEVLKYVDMANGLSNVYIDYITNSQEDDQSYKTEVFGTKGRSKGVHASEISKCNRALVLGIMGIERKVDTSNNDINMLMRFKVGHAVHSMLQNDWKQIAKKSKGLITFKDEVKIEPGNSEIAKLWNIHSRCDGIITCYGDYNKTSPQIRVGLEIKTISDDGYSKLKAPQADHLEQTTLYMKALDLPLMWICYYNKNNSNFTPSHNPFLFTFDKNVWDNILEMRIAKCTYLADTNNIPDCTEGIHCRWCSFSWHCKPPLLTKHRKSKV